MSRIQFAGMDIDKYKTPEFYQEKNKKYVNYGSDNLYPLYLVDLFNRSAKHNAILTGKQTYVYGAGLEMEGTWNLFANANRFDSLDEIFNKCILDKLLYGGYTIKEITCTKSGCKVWIERDYLFMECYFDLTKNEFKS